MKIGSSSPDTQSGMPREVGGFGLLVLVLYGLRIYLGFCSLLDSILVIFPFLKIIHFIAVSRFIVSSYS